MIAGSGRPTWNRLTAPAMAGLLVLYVVVHSPLRDALAGLLLGRQTHTPYFASPMAPAIDLLPATLALFAIAAACTAALSVADRFRPRRACEWPIVVGVGAFALLAVPAAAIGAIAAMVGVPLLRPPLGPLLTSIPALVVVAGAAAAGWRPSLHVPTPSRRLISLAIAFAGALLLISAGLSMRQPPTGFDALAYHGPLAVYLWRDGDLVTFLHRSPEGFALAQPASAELWFGLLRLAGGEGLANLGQLPFALLAAAAVYALARRTGARRSLSGFAAAGFLLAPLVVAQAGMQLNDVVAASLVLCAGALACAADREWTPARGLLIGCALGLAVTTKLAVLPGAGAVAIFAAARLVRGSTTPAAIRGGGALLLAAAVAVAPWWTRNVVLYGNPLYPAAIPLLGRGVVVGDFAQKDDHFVPTRAAWPLYPLLEPLNDQSGFGPLLLVCAVPGLLVGVTRRRRSPLMLLAITATLMLPPWWLLTQHEPRHLLVLAGLTFAFVPAAMAAVPRRARALAVGVTTATVLFSALVTFDQILLPRARQDMTRPAFYDAVWNVDPVVAGIAEDEPLLYNTGYASLSYAGDYPLLGPSLGRALFTLDSGADTARIVSMMRDAHVRYAYVPASADAQSRVEATYSSAWFDVAHVSVVASGERQGTRRYLFRLRDASSHDPLEWRRPHQDGESGALR